MASFHVFLGGYTQRLTRWPPHISEDAPGYLHHPRGRHLPQSDLTWLTLTWVSIDANRGRDWLARQVKEMVADAERVDAAEDAGDGPVVADRAAGMDRSGRRERITAAAAQVEADLALRTGADEAAERAALERRRRSEAGQPVRGRIPKGPHHLAEARAHLAREVAIHQAKLDRYAGLIAAGKKPMGRPPLPMEDTARVRRARAVVAAAEAAEEQPEQGEPGKRSAARFPSVTANTTDPQSRVMPTRKGYLQGYNVQVAVTGDHLIAAVTVTQSPNDQSSLLPMMRAAVDAAAGCHAVTGDDTHQVGVVLADAGYAREANLAAPGPDRLIALSTRRDQARAATASATSGPPPPGATPRQAMQHRLRTPAGAALYKRRGATVEPVIGNLKTILDRFARRGLTAATSEIHLAALAHNLLKLHRAAA